ncbi:MAG: hypothetical protein C6I01_01285 [Epsilonproteobacteria bacterium]|jgi:hypothetical protein|nr:hypothetical protein [Campylobacterota bacterium]NPA89250.1 hypothetical protein [Campylobacterota bacterium]
MKKTILGVICFTAIVAFGATTTGNGTAQGASANPQDIKKKKMKIISLIEQTSPKIPLMMKMPNLKITPKKGN